MCSLINDTAILPILNKIIHIRSGTEEEFTEIEQLLEDICTYNEDFEVVVKREEESKLARKKEDKKKGEEMRLAAMTTISQRYTKSASAIGENCLNDYV